MGIRWALRALVLMTLATVLADAFGTWVWTGMVILSLGWFTLMIITAPRRYRRRR